MTGGRYPEPDFEQRGGQWVVTIWRDWLTEEVIVKLGLNERQMQVITYLKINGVITNADLQKLVGCPQRTASRDLSDLNQKGVIELEGKGRGARYRLVRKRATNTPNAPSRHS